MSTTVAGAVVTIDGDSSGLVGALQKGEKGLADVKQESAKLSDQLREVTDAADQAAGALVQKIGGPGAIKAIAGVTAAMAGAKAATDFFLDSAEQLFKSFGDEGVKVWDDVEKSLFAVKGAFAEAVLGGGEMEQMGAKLKVMFETVKDVVNFLLTPVRILGSALWALRGDTEDLTTATDNLNVAIGETAEAQAKAAKTTVAQSANIKVLYAQALNDLGLQQIAAQDAALTSADAYQQGFQEALGKAATTAAKILSDGKIYVQDYRDAVEEVVLGLEESPEQMRQAYGALAKAGMVEEIKQLEVLRQARDKALATAQGGIEPAAAPKGNAGAKRAIDETVFVLDLLNGEYAKLTQAQADAILTTERMLGESSGRVFEMKQSEYDQLETLKADHDAAMIAMETDKLQREEALRAESGAKAQAELDRARNEADEFAAKAAQKKLDDRKKELATIFDLTVTGNAKMLGAAIAANKSMAEVARAAIGNVVSALGDKAMVEASAYAVEGNFLQAAGMAAVGTTMYTVAAALGAQKKPNAGPPTERQQPVQNYAYNLRIDAAFADSESISRRFAQMQEGARQRGLIAGVA